MRKIGKMQRNPARRNRSLLILALFLSVTIHAEGQQKPTVSAPIKPRLGQAGSQVELDDYNKLRSEANLAEKNL